ALLSTARRWTTRLSERGDGRQVPTGPFSIMTAGRRRPSEQCHLLPLLPGEHLVDIDQNQQLIVAADHTINIASRFVVADTGGGVDLRLPDLDDLGHRVYQHPGDLVAGLDHHNARAGLRLPARQAEAHARIDARHHVAAPGDDAED